MAQSMHGILACSGNATRFAASVGAQAPYPKHLEQVAGRSVLDRSVESMATFLPVSDVTVILNPQLEEAYIAHLRQLQGEYPHISLHYVLQEPHERSGLMGSIRDSMKDGIYTLDGEKKAFGDPVVAVGFGDAIVRGNYSSEVHRLVTAQMKNIEYGDRLVVGAGFGRVFGPMMIYNISRFSRLTDRFRADMGIDGLEHDIAVWNINRKEDIHEAENDLPFYGLEFEGARRGGKEF
jgi:hypothetical protein